jgi:TolA-binding protein
MYRIQQIAMAAIVAAALASPVVAQQQQNYSQVTQADIQRLQDSVFQAGSDVQQLKSRDATRASQLQAQLDDLRDEVTYLKVKLRKEGSVQRTEYAAVRDRLDDLRSQATNYTTNYTPSTGSNTAGNGPATTATTTASRAAGTASTATAQSPSTARNVTPAQATGTATGREVEVPSGTELDVRLSNVLNSGTAKVEDRFEGTTLVDLNIEGRTVIPAGSVMRGVVTSVDPATRTNRTAKMTVSFDQVTINGRAYPIRGTVTQAIQGEGIKGEAGKIATGAGVGAVLGGILGGVKGAILGTVIGGGGITAATEGKEVELPQGSVLRVRLDSPVQIQSAR